MSTPTSVIAASLSLLDATHCAMAYCDTLSFICMPGTSPHLLDHVEALAVHNGHHAQQVKALLRQRACKAATVRQCQALPGVVQDTLT